MLRGAHPHAKVRVRALQVWLAQHAVPHVVELVCEPLMQSRPHLMTMLSKLLENLSSNRRAPRGARRAPLGAGASWPPCSVGPQLQNACSLGSDVLGLYPIGP